jgi:hypothetical protein
MSPASIKIVKTNLEIFETIYKLQQSKSNDFYFEEIEEMILLAIAANNALLDRMRMYNNNSLIIPNSNN